MKSASRRAAAGWFILSGILALVACNFPLGPSGPQGRPTVVVITSVGPYFAAFDDIGDWLTGDTETSTGAISDGAFHLTLKKPGTLAWTHQQRAASDGVYEFDTWLVSGPEASGFGILLVAATDLSSFLYILITGDGRYDISVCSQTCQDQQSLIGGYQLSYAIIPGSVVNHIRAELRSGTLNLFVNGTPVSTVPGLIYGEGLFGFIGESSQYGGFEAAFDNLQVTEFLEPTASPAVP